MRTTKFEYSKHKTKMYSNSCPLLFPHRHTPPPIPPSINLQSLAFSPLSGWLFLPSHLFTHTCTRPGLLPTHFPHAVHFHWRPTAVSSVFAFFFFCSPFCFLYPHIQQRHYRLTMRGSPEKRRPWIVPALDCMPCPFL